MLPNFNKNIKKNVDTNYAILLSKGLPIYFYMQSFKFLNIYPIET